MSSSSVAVKRLRMHSMQLPLIHPRCVAYWQGRINDDEE